MSGFLRIVGIVNAAIWFGAGVFFAGGVLPAVFSPEMHAVFRDPAFQYYAGAVALVLFKRFFLVQYFCGGIALAHLLAEKLYLGRPLPRLGTGLVLVLLGMALLGGLALQPHLENLRHTMYFAAAAGQREEARSAFGLWHGLSQFANILIIIGLAAHLVRMTKPAAAGRYSTFYQIP